VNQLCNVHRPIGEQQHGSWLQFVSCAGVQQCQVQHNSMTMRAKRDHAQCLNQHLDSIPLHSGSCAEPLTCSPGRGGQLHGEHRTNIAWVATVPQISAATTGVAPCIISRVKCLLIPHCCLCYLAGLSCPVLSCPVLSCPVLSCPVLSCRIYTDGLSKDSKQSLISWLVAVITLTLYTGAPIARHALD
jgi:hypothetical protein